MVRCHPRRVLATAAALAPLVACDPEAAVRWDGGVEVAAPLTAYCQAQVQGGGMVDGEALRGWAQDPDAPGQTVDVHLYVGGPAGDATAIAVTARADLCTAIGSCAHGFERPTPRGLGDGQERPVYAYGIDLAGGANALLGSSPRSLRCEPPLLPWSPATAACAG